MRVGTWPSKRSHRARARPMMFLAFTRKKPVGRTRASTLTGSATARSSGAGYWANNEGVTEFTRSSVVWAESTVATNSCQGVEKSSSQSSGALPGVLLGQPGGGQPGPARGRPGTGRQPRLPYARRSLRHC